MLNKLKGTLVAEAYKHFNRLPALPLQQALKAEGWDFQTITGAGGPGISDHLHRVIHPDGKPLDGLGSPGYVTGSDGPIILKEAKPEIAQRWQDFSTAIAKAKPPRL